MAVYSRAWHGYEGRLTPEWSRFLILPRYAYERVMASLVFKLFLALGVLVPFSFAVVIYLRYNLRALEFLEIPASALAPIGSEFFLSFLASQGIFLGLLLAVFVGPALVSEDLVHNALPLYLGRPLSRAEYILGKFSVLAILLSLLTWVPGLLLFALQASLAGRPWLSANGHIALAIFVSSWVWIVVLSLLTLALSALVRRKTLAGLALIVIFFVAAGFGEAINGTLHTHWGGLLNIGELVRVVWSGLFEVEARGAYIPVWAAWASLLTMAGLCLWILARKVRAYPVTRG